MAGMDINQLATNLAHARSEEAKAKAARIAAENAILNQYDLADQGSQTVKTDNGLKLTLKTALNYKVDAGVRLPDCVTKTTTKTELDVKAYEGLSQSDPALFAEVARHVTTTPRKPSVTLAVQ